MKEHTDKFLVPAKGQVKLTDYNPAYKDGFENEAAAQEQLRDDIKRLSKLQDKLYAGNKYSVLVIFQAMDAAGKDGAIKHIMSGLNPQGCQVYSFKHPSDEEYDHDFLWRHYKALPERGRIGIFNRSHYENVLICKVHPQYVLAEHLPNIDSVDKVDANFWEQRYKQINRFEKNITQNGTVVLKFFLHLSKDEQRRRFLDRIDNPEKNWKFSFGDINERGYWDEYQKAYEDTLSQTSTTQAPWYVIPADNKWFARTAIANIMVQTLEGLDLKYPDLPAEEKAKLSDAKKKLLSEEK
jgi:PPK2 family polyphosphate:nucleotide phosphotransferase